MHQSSDLVLLFDRCFRQSFETVLIGGALEPLYEPKSDASAFHRIYFTRDYFASALHEIAHWCIAGEQRRQQLDYGYWYAPDGRTEQQQKVFETVEVKPQALEWIFAEAAGASFRVSADNLQTGLDASSAFKHSIVRQAVRYCREGVNGRAGAFIEALQTFYQRHRALQPQLYTLEKLN